MRRLGVLQNFPSRQGGVVEVWLKQAAALRLARIKFGCRDAVLPMESSDRKEVQFDQGASMVGV